MGPITLFDKSFLQSLSVDESVWFDHFFIANVCPLFFVETLADLEKSVRNGRTPEQEVGVIADKFPEMHGTPNVQHVHACIGELLGHPVPMTGQMLVAGGKVVKAGGETGVVFDRSPEAEAFDRWYKHKFLDVERMYARDWRETVTNLDLVAMAETFRNLGIDGKSCNNLEKAKELAEQVVCAGDKPFDRMKLALLFLNVPQQYHRQILERWGLLNYPPLDRYAPYVSHVLTVEIFFQIALAAKLISTDRPSNRVDIAYLFYLPFSLMFVSSDKLHRRCAPLFLRQDQQFIWGPDLKEGLNAINQHYSQLPESEKARGVMSFGFPPKEGDFLISKIWDYHFRTWRNKQEIDLSDPKIKHEEIAKHISKFTKAPVLAPEEIDFDQTDTDSLTLERSVRRKKGSWLQVSNDIPDAKPV